MYLVCKEIAVIYCGDTTDIAVEIPLKCSSGTVKVRAGKIGPLHKHPEHQPQRETS